ncbi:MAG TPA: phytochelatin synthase family protein [Gammaproteobacteria bacterium]|nr:phytochelatin synthase family protein [Gammaproteobacteria bacterium]
MSTCTQSPYASSPVERTLYMRPLPASLTALDSGDGRAVFRRALLEGTLEGYFKLAQQFHTQADPAFCGLGSLVCALNALGIDPRRRWKGSWRWFSEELLDCCKSLDEVRRSGITLDDAACLARCSGAAAAVHRAGRESLELFRGHLLTASTASDGPVLIVNYSRRAVGQTGDGHFSPVAGFDAATDQALVLDTARFKYPPHWMPVEALFAAMQARDADTGESRGWMLLTSGAGAMAA